MKISVEFNGETIWYRDEEKGEGMTSTGYIKDGTQQKIITALEHALVQAKTEKQCWDYLLQESININANAMLQNEELISRLT
ncbi:Rrf2 family transcriptional regulator [Xenorhabdus nematophila]|uniref:hypothetical protein n=1 Tax=Xenorhabdus nematophila TaxID=628 RepID=UPI0003275693|nr:hypothetical protein [Xenorhabdus nematophila]CCW31054.1 conserved hypothetical protein [Xenorhabdus nematophila F1]